MVLSHTIKAFNLLICIANLLWSLSFSLMEVSLGEIELAPSLDDICTMPSWCLTSGGCYLWALLAWFNRRKRITVKTFVSCDIYSSGCILWFFSRNKYKLTQNEGQLSRLKAKQTIMVGLVTLFLKCVQNLLVLMVVETKLVWWGHLI